MLTIAIDGPAASGKGTLAKRIAAHYGLGCLDTGLLYRAVGRDVLESGGSLEDETGGGSCSARARFRHAQRSRPALARHGRCGLRRRQVSEGPRCVLDFQREFAAQEPGAVLDGRDIGTVVLPDADVKIYVTADVEVRARRRYEESIARGEPVTYERVLETIRAPRRPRHGPQGRAAARRPTTRSCSTPRSSTSSRPLRPRWS